VIDAPRRVIASVLQKSSEDYAGLWEIPITLRSLEVRDPESMAKSLVRELLDEGLVQCVWGDPNPESNAVLDQEECGRVLFDDSFWREDTPFAGRTVWLSTTPRGEAWMATTTT